MDSVQRMFPADHVAVRRWDGWWVRHTLWAIGKVEVVAEVRANEAGGARADA
jgi:hypothetical protein